MPVGVFLFAHAGWRCTLGNVDQHEGAQVSKPRPSIYIGSCLLLWEARKVSVYTLTFSGFLLPFLFQLLRLRFVSSKRRRVMPCLLARRVSVASFLLLLLVVVFRSVSKRARMNMR